MQKKLTITLDERVYDGLHTVVGRAHQPVHRVPCPPLRRRAGSGVRLPADGSGRVAGGRGLEWAEATAGDVADEAR